MKTKKIITRLFILLLVASLFAVGLPFGAAASTTAITNGNYYVRNEWTLYYLTMSESEPIGSTAVVQAALIPSNTQYWEFTSTGDGYFAIRCVKTGYMNGSYFLTASNISNGSAVTAEYDYGASYTDDNQRWKVVETTSGNYKIINKAGESNNLVLSLANSSVSGGYTELPIVIKTYVDNATYDDEWTLGSP